MKERYNIAVSDELVEITGNLSIREAFDFLNFFEREGYGILEGGEYGTTFCIRKGSAEAERREAINKESLEHIENLEFDKKQLNEENSKLKDRIAILEHLIKKMGAEGVDINARLKEATDNLSKFRSLEKLKNSAEAAQICAMQGPGAEMEDLTNG
jgi:vacuolar-type H+-ATPase subunit I/STV1